MKGFFVSLLVVGIVYYIMNVVFHINGFLSKTIMLSCLILYMLVKPKKRNETSKRE